MLDVLLEAGADINAKSQWWAGGFCLLDFANDDLSQYAIERGARVEAHAAARLGMMDRLRELISTNPALADAKGGDGKRPLHFARTVEIAKYLLEQGAEIDALDVDHESTAAQHLIGERPEVARYLVERGGKSDIFLAAALGDLELSRKHVAANPNCVAMRISCEDFPMENPRAGGAIYQWTLGGNLSPHQVARKFGHENVFAFLNEHTPAKARLMNALLLGDETDARKLLAENPGVIASLPEKELRAIADAARDNNAAAVRLMLEAGFPNDARGDHKATPLHWAAWHGNAAAVEALLQTEPPLELKDADFQGTPMRWVIHGSANSWHRKEGDHAKVATMLLRAGAKPLPAADGSAAVREAIAAFAK
jgi:ankyrin repeat protein